MSVIGTLVIFALLLIAILSGVAGYSTYRLLRQRNKGKIVFVLAAGVLAFVAFMWLIINLAAGLAG